MMGDASGPPSSLPRICREVGGVWDDGEPCGMDAVLGGQRCDWHTPGVATALAVAIRTGMVDLATGRLLRDPEAGLGLLATATRARLAAVHADPRAEAELTRLLGLVPEYYHLLWASWDLASVPATDDTIALADEHQAHLRRLRDELGLRAETACFKAALEVYRDTPGKRWPLQRRRHTKACTRPYDEQGRDSCDCPMQLDWEAEEGR